MSKPIHERKIADENFLTDHALIQAKRRGISLETLETVLTLGDRRTRVPGDCRVISLSRKHADYLIVRGLPAGELDRAVGINVIVSREGAIVTVEHQYGRIRGWRRAVKNRRPSGITRLVEALC